MDKYLIEILKEVNTVIIPGLGALTITDSEKGDLLFMPYLKYDDGKLINYIIQKEGLAKNDACNLIAKYVREIESKLNIGESYDMYQFGAFLKNNKGEIIFKSWKELQLEKSQKNNEQTSITNVSVIHDVPSESLGIKEQDVAVQIVSVSPEEYSEDEQWNDDLDILPINYQIKRPKQPIVEKTNTDKPKRRIGVTIILTLLVLLVGGILTYSLFYNTMENTVRKFASKNVPKKKEIHLPTVSNEKERNETSKQLNVSQEKAEVIEKKIDTTSLISYAHKSSENKYQIVMGAFKNKVNAEKYAEALREKGAPASIITKMDGLYLVSYGSYSTISERAKNIRSARQISPQAWLMIFP